MKHFRVLAVLTFLSSLLFLSLVGCAATGGPSAVNPTGKPLALANDFIELQFDTSGGRCTADKLVNKLANRTLDIKSDDFAIGIEGREPLRAADFTFKNARDKAIPGGRRLTLRFESKAPATLLYIIYELGDSDWFVRRRIELVPEELLALRQVDVWLVGLDGKAAHQGFGQSVLLDDTFWGLEFPAGHNHYDGAVVKLTQFPGRTVTGRFVSKTAVLGVAEPGRSEQRFRQYVETFRVTPKTTSLFVNYNTWWTLMPPSEKNSLELTDLFKRKLHDPHGESIDTFTVDDGWDNNDSLWEFQTENWPDGFVRLKRALNTMNSSLGLWISPSSRYGPAPWLAENKGYALHSNGHDICQSDPVYRLDMAKTVTDLIKKYDIAFIKFDGFGGWCDAKDHAHHLPGEYSMEANTDAYIELIEAARKVRPDIYLDLTCGIWLSPWWLMYADSLWGSVSGDYPSIVVPAPVLRDSATTTRDAVFRQRCRENAGFPPAAIEHLGIIIITPEKWEDNAVAVVGRGCRLLTLYIDPKHFQNEDRDWKFLASILKYARHNAETLQNINLILGDPFKREPYGYASFRGPRGIITLRNPFIEPKTVTLTLDESIGCSLAEHDDPDKAQSAFVARIVYPRVETLSRTFHYGDTLEIELQAYETLLLHLDSVEPGFAPPYPPGIRGREISRSANGMTFEAYERGTAEPACTVEGGELLEEEASETSWQIVGTSVVNVPPATKASVYVLCEPTEHPKEGFLCTATINGNPQEARSVRAPRRGGWTWFIFDLPEGKSEVVIAATSASGGGTFRGKIGSWLWIEHKLQKRTLTAEFDKPLPPARPEPLPLPLNMEYERHIITIQPPKLFATGHPWPDPVALEKFDQPVVYLDEVIPDEATQGWGTLQRRQSVWEKEMIIAGKTYARGLGTHADGKIVYKLPKGKYTKFLCEVGRDQHTLGSTVVLQVWVDGKKLFDSGPMDRTMPAKPVEVDITGAAVLELRTLSGGDGGSGDHADWANARLVK